MLKVILAKIGFGLFSYLPLEQIVAKLLTGVIKKLVENPIVYDLFTICLRS